jgi:hypothetical protein
MCVCVLVPLCVTISCLENLAEVDTKQPTVGVVNRLCIFSKCDFHCAKEQRFPFPRLFCF